MAEIPGSYAEPYRDRGRVPPVPPLADLSGSVAGSRPWAGAVATLVRRSAKSAVWLLCWAVLPAGPAAGVIAVVASAFEDRGGHGAYNSLPWDLGLVLMLPWLVPLMIAGGYLVARVWAGAAWVVASRAAGRPVSAKDGMRGGKRTGLLWAAYVAGVAVLCVIAGLADDIMANAHLVRDVLISVGPLGLTGLAAFFAPGQLYAEAARRTRHASPVWPTVTVCAVLTYQVLVGLAVSPMIDAARAPAVCGVLLAFLLSVPGTLVLAAASHISYAASHEGDD